MADFGITAVKYNDKGEYIEFVHVREVTPGRLEKAHVVPREFVADLIRLKKATFQTWTRNKEGLFQIGEMVHVIEGIYLSTDPNGRTNDNLASLPKF